MTQENPQPKEHEVTLPTTVVIPPRSAQCIKTQHNLEGFATSLFSPHPDLPEHVMSLHSLSQGPYTVIHLANFGDHPVTLKRHTLVGRVEAIEETTELVYAAHEEDCQTTHLPRVDPDVPDHARCQIENVLQAYKEIFSQHEGDYGCTTLIQHEIHTQGPPIRLSY